MRQNSDLLNKTFKVGFKQEGQEKKISEDKMHARVTHTISQAGSWGGGAWHLAPDRITNDEVKL